MSYELVLSLPMLPKLPNQLLYKSFWLVKKEKDYWHSMIGYAIPQAKRPEKPLERAQLTLVRRSAQECDPDALAGSFKYVIDALVACGVLAGDTSAHVQISARWEKAKPKFGSIYVEVKECAS